MITTRILFCIPGALVLAASSPAQSTWYPIEGPSAGAHAGSCVAALGDVDADGYDDYAVGTPSEIVGSIRPGRVRIYSGATHALLRTLTGSADGDSFGRSISTAGDVNLDGKCDLIVGAPYSDSAGTDAGRAYVFSGANGAVLYDLYGSWHDDQFGSSVAGGGDADGDGRPDFVAGSPGYDGYDSSGLLESTGKVEVFSGVTGLEIAQDSNNYAPYAQYGFAVAFAGDVDLDGHDEVLVSAPFLGSGTGSMYVWDVATDSSDGWVGGNATGDLCGWSLAGAGDVNGDGRADYAVSSPFHANHQGRVRVYSGGNNVLLFTFDGPPDSLFGHSIANAGDANGDGHDDLVVGAPLDQFGFLGTLGSARLFSGANGALLETLPGPATGSYFGGSVAGAFDANGDGTGDVLVGAENADVTAADAGQARLVFLDDAAGTLYCFGDGSGTSCPCFNGSPASARAGCENSLGLGAQIVASGRASISADTVELVAVHMPNGTSLFFQGTSAQSSGAGAVFGDGLRCASGTIVRLATHGNLFNRSTYPVGSEEPVSVRGAVPAGTSRYYQVWYRNAATFCTASTFNLTNGVRIDWRP